MSSRFSIFFSKWLAWLTCRHSIAVLVVGVIFAIASVALTINRLSFQSDRNDLLSKDLEWNKRILDWWESFPHMSDMAIVVDTATGPGDADQQRTRARAFVQDLAHRLEQMPEIVNVDWGAPENAFTEKAARLQSLSEFTRTIRRAQDVAPIIANPSVTDALGAMSTSLSQNRSAAQGAPQSSLVDALTELSHFIRAIGHELAPSPNTDPFQELAAGDDADWHYLESPNRRFILLRLTHRREQGVLDATAQSIVSVRKVLADAQADHPGIEAGLTGIDVIESDETRVATLDSALSSALAFVLIAALLITAFHGWRKPLQAMLALVIGIAWTFGFLTLVIGHLQILSVVFVVILLSLGIDYAIHLSTTIEEFRHEHPDGREPFREVLSESFRLTGPGVITGAATTAAAFAATTLTDFRGVAELGIVACGGIALCLVAMFTIYPALLAIFHHSHRHIRPLASRAVHVFHEDWLAPIVRHPLATVVTALVIVTISAAAGTRVRFSQDLLALQPKGVDSVQWQQRLPDDGEVSIWYAVSICNSLDEARARRDAFMALPNVSHVGGIGILFPNEDEQKLSLVRDARASLRLDDVPRHQPQSIDDTTLANQLQGMRSLLRASTRGADLSGPLGDALDQLDSDLQRTTEALAELTGTPRADALARLAASYAQFRAAVIARTDSLLDPSPLTQRDLPDAVMNSFIDPNGAQGPRYALEAHPKTPIGVDSPLDPRFLGDFMRDVQSVDPRVTGVLPQIYFSNELIRDSFIRSGSIAAVVVFLIVLLVFRSPVFAAMSMVPVVIGFLLTFGVMSVFGMNINPANIIVLPVLFGIGVDSGVHIMHRYRLNPRERPLGLTHGTGKGVTLTCLTTMVGFASMLVARHRGIESLGLLLAIGIGLTMLTSWTVVPAVLELRARARGETEASPGKARRSAA